ncbi:MAG: hypothetical protein AAGU75_18510, partial [Bacillota bacterium]
MGLKAYASDLNPVAVMINKSMIEIPPKFAGQPPVNPESKKLFGTWEGMQGLAEDVRYYGEWMKQKAWERIGHLYPKVRDGKGKEHTVIAWLWARAVKCPNPACGCVTPLVSSFVLSKRRGSETYVQPIIEDKSIRYEVRYGKKAPDGTMRRRNGAVCIFCDHPIDYAHIKAEGHAKRIKHHLMAIAAEGKGSRLYFSPDETHVSATKIEKPENIPEGVMPRQALGFVAQLYGPKQYTDLFTNRQLSALITFSDLVAETQKQITIDGGSKKYAEDVAVYLAFLIDKMADLGNSLSGWEPNAQCPRHLFARQTIPIVWDFAEANIFSESSGSWSVFLNNLTRSFSSDLFDFVREKPGQADQLDAQRDNGLRNVMISTDPPYYDNIGYADLSDFFYIWLRRSLKQIYPELFRTLLVPKSDELVATPYRFDNNIDKAKNFFEDGMLKTFKQVLIYTHDDIPVSIYYAFKQTESVSEGLNGNTTASTGWETMLSAIIQSGFAITGTWPIRTEMSSRAAAQGNNALASSIVIV